MFYTHFHRTVYLMNFKIKLLSQNPCPLSGQQELYFIIHMVCSLMKMNVIAIPALVRSFSKFHGKKDPQYLVMYAYVPSLCMIKSCFCCRKVEYKKCFVSHLHSFIKFCNKRRPSYRQLRERWQTRSSLNF